MKLIKILAVLALIYVAIVALFESLLGYFQPEAPNTVVISTFDPDGTRHDRVLSGLESGEAFYVAVNHWPRAWYRRALSNPAVKLTRDGATQDYNAVLVSGAERDRVAMEHPIPLVVRILMGFAPRHFLRLDPVAAELQEPVPGTAANPQGPPRAPE